MKKPTLSTHNCTTVHSMKASNNKKLVKHQIMVGLDDIKSGKVSDGKKFMQDLKEKISTLIAFERDPFYSKENIKRLESAINDAKSEKICTITNL